MDYIDERREERAKVSFYFFVGGIRELTASLIYSRIRGFFEMEAGATRRIFFYKFIRFEAYGKWSYTCGRF